MRDCGEAERIMVEMVDVITKRKEKRTSVAYLISSNSAQGDKNDGKCSEKLHLHEVTEKKKKDWRCGLLQFPRFCLYCKPSIKDV